MLELLLPLLPLSLTSGINLYLTVLGLGASERLGAIDLPANLAFVGSTPVLAAAAFMTLIEFFADKIPIVDSFWDFLHTFVRPAGALALAFGFVPPDQPELMMAAGLVAGTTALTAHSSKASFRALVNTSPEPVSNSAVSLLEDGLVVALLVLAARYPVTTAAISAVLVVVLAIATFFIVRWGIRAFGSLRNFLSRKPTATPRPIDTHP